MTTTILADGIVSQFIRELLLIDCNLITCEDSTSLKSQIPGSFSSEKVIISCLGVVDQGEAESVANIIVNTVQKNSSVQYIICSPIQSSEIFETIRRKVSSSKSLNVRIDSSFQAESPKSPGDPADVNKKFAEYVIDLAKGDGTMSGTLRQKMASFWEEPRNKKIGASVGLLLLIGIIIIIIAVNIPANKNEEPIFPDPVDFQKIMLFDNRTHVFVRTLTEKDGYTFPQAKDGCREFNSSLWSIRYGEEEWNKVYNYLIAQDKKQVWLDATSNEPCGDGRDTCKFEEAKIGEGMPLTWNGCNDDPKNYTRLISGKREDYCVFTADSSPVFWRSGPCRAKTLSALCVIHKDRKVCGNA